MRDAETWIKLNRNMLEWRWYKDQNTKALFIHLLIKASIKNQDYRDVSVRRGELVTSLATLAEETGMSIQNVRTALGHLKSTQEVTVKKVGKISVISIPEYSRYQDDLTQSLTSNQQDSNRDLTGCQHQYKNIRNKEYKNTPQTPRGLTEEEERMRRVMWGSWRPEDDERGN